MCILFGLAGFMCGGLISHYSANYINNCEDSLVRVEYRLISTRTVVLSILNAILWGLAEYCYRLSADTVLICIFISLLLTLSAVDWVCYEIPFNINVVIFILGLINLFMNRLVWYDFVIGMFLVSGVLYIIYLVSKGRAMGGGDIKLMFAAGLFLGWKYIVLGFVLGCILGAVIHSIRMKIAKQEKMLAFGPYLAAGMILTLFVGEKILNWYFGLFPTVY